MAGLHRDKNGCQVIQFDSPDGKRKTIRLGDISDRNAQAFRKELQDLIEARQVGRPFSADVVAWIDGLSEKYRKRLVAVGLVEDRVAHQLGPFIEVYIESRCDVKEATKLTWLRAKNHLLGFFDADRDLAGITEAEAEDWERWMRYKRLSRLQVNTARKSISIAKQWFNSAIKRRLVTANPFAGLSGSVGGNPSRMRFITRDNTERVLAACPDAQWRLIFALARFGGLRVPSEVVALTWDDVDWDSERLTVHASKTAHHRDKGVRLMPLFPELVPHLLGVFEQAEPHTKYVITRCQGKRRNLGQHMNRIIKRAGLEPWPKTFQNLRSSRETELAAFYPLHVVTGWIGNSQRVAEKHYLQITDDDYKRASAGASEALQKALQHVRASKCIELHGGSERFTEVENRQADNVPVQVAATSCDSVQNVTNGPSPTPRQTATSPPPPPKPSSPSCPACGISYPHLAPHAPSMPI